jgi:hypothetical protein
MIDGQCTLEACLKQPELLGGPLPSIDPDFPELPVSIDDEHGLCIGNCCSGSFESNIESILWNTSMIPYEIGRRELECIGCSYPVIGIGVDILGVIADFELLLTGDPGLSAFTSFVETGHFTAGVISNNVDIYDAQLYQDQQVADAMAPTPIIGINYSLWGLWLNIQDIAQRFKYHIGN